MAETVLITGGAGFIGRFVTDELLWRGHRVRVLDSLIDPIQPASQRTDLLPVYSFNAEGLYLPGAKGNKKVGDTKRLSRWQDVLKKMRAEGFPAEPAN